MAPIDIPQVGDTVLIKELPNVAVESEVKWTASMRVQRVRRLFVIQRPSGLDTGVLFAAHQEDITVELAADNSEA